MKYLLVLLSVIIPQIVFGQPGQPGTPPGKLANPLKGADSLFDLVNVVLNQVVIPIGSIIIVFFIIYSGFLFVTARGNETKISHAKETLLWVVVGAAILLGSWAISGAIKGTICQISPELEICDFVLPSSL